MNDLDVMKNIGWVVLIFAGSCLGFGIAMFAAYTHDTAVITISEKEFGSSVGHIFATDGDHYVVTDTAVYGSMKCGGTYKIHRATHIVFKSKNIDSASEI